MDPVLMRALRPESSMDPVLVQKMRSFVQIAGLWMIIRLFFIDISSMDPILMHAIVHGPCIGAKRLEICAEIELMDETGSLLVAV